MKKKEPVTKDKISKIELAIDKEIKTFSHTKCISIMCGSDLDHFGLDETSDQTTDSSCDIHSLSDSSDSSLSDDSQSLLQISFEEKIKRNASRFHKFKQSFNDSFIESRDLYILNSNELKNKNNSQDYMIFDLFHNQENEKYYLLVPIFLSSDFLHYIPQKIGFIIDAFIIYE